MCHIVHMKEITIRELHLKTGAWARKAAADGQIIVTERGHPLVTLMPYHPSHRGISFSERKLAPEFSRLKSMTGDITEIISDDRNRM